MSHSTDAVPAEQRLMATLRFLATGRSVEDLKYSCVISPQLLGKIIPETCVATYKVLRRKYLCVSIIIIVIAPPCTFIYRVFVFVYT
ncbi:hypothetical protein NQ314_010583 [Rhamnusium bicolor]|uniref:Uncharacterized protein n=1 Tax=Rhamnusium bicolor TaxID=1586634 RepID=A0AAV8XQC3_9CUCU|nr:hypothetical protein NQ314_010583 [Rhamnusium bicolor]